MDLLSVLQIKDEVAKCFPETRVAYSADFATDRTINFADGIPFCIDALSMRMVRLMIETQVMFASVRSVDVRKARVAWSIAAWDLNEDSRDALGIETIPFGRTDIPSKNVVCLTTTTIRAMRFTAHYVTELDEVRRAMTIAWGRSGTSDDGSSRRDPKPKLTFTVEGPPQVQRTIHFKTEPFPPKKINDTIVFRSEDEFKNYTVDADGHEFDYSFDVEEDHEPFVPDLTEQGKRDDEFHRLYDFNRLYSFDEQ